MENQTSTQETLQEATPAQDTTTTTTETTQATSATKATDQTATPAPETWEYKGDRKDVPDTFKKYVEGLDRYVSKKDQATAELRKKAEEFESFRNSEDYKAYQQFIAKKPTSTGTSEPQKPTITQEEIDAISLGDGKTLEAVIERKAKELLKSELGPKEAEINQKFAAMDLKERQIQSAEMIQSFAEVHPDFWELYDNGLEEYIVGAIKSGLSLEATYAKAKFIESKMEERAETKRKADFEKKKAGTVAGKSIPGSPDVVYADSEDHAKRLAIELTLKGDKRHVRIRDKQKK